jgi:hypothetical protein
MAVEEFELEENYDDPTSKWLSMEGTYHLYINKYMENVTNKDGEPMNCFCIEVEAMDGTARQDGKFLQAGRTKELNFFWPGDDTSDKGRAMMMKKISRLYLATGLVPPGTKGKVSVDREDMQGRQFIAKLVYEDDEAKSKGWLQISYADVYHVDDPEVATIPKQAELLAEIPKELRWTDADKKSSKPKKDKPSGDEPSGGFDPSSL